MIIYVNALDTPISFNKRDYLLRAEVQYGLGIFKDYRDPGDHEYVLNVEPCDIQMGSKWTGFWHIDSYLNNNYASQYGLFNAVFVATTNSGRLTHSETAYTLFQACDPELYHGEVEKQYDFVICGSLGDPLYTKRDKAYSALKGAGFTYYDHQKGHTASEYIKKIREARVQFIRTGEGPGGTCNAAQRFFECIAIGPVLTNWTPDLIHTGFVEDEDYLAYRSEEEMLQKMDRLLKDTKYAHRIALNGRMKAYTYHTYVQRALAIYNVAKYADTTISRL